MSSIASGDPTQKLIMSIKQNEKQYTLKLKVNLLHTRESVATLIDEDNKIHVIAKDCILWLDLNPTMPSKKIPKMIEAVAASILIIPTTYPGKPFEVRIPLKLVNNEVHFEPVAKEELPENQVRILTVKTKADYSQLFTLYKSSDADLFFHSTDMTHQFTVISPWKSSDTAEMIALLEFLNEENQVQTISKFIEIFSSLKTTVVAIELLVATKIPPYRSLAGPLLIAASETFADKSVVWKDDLEHLIRIFEHFLPEHQGVFVDRLTTACQPTAAKNLVENLTEAFKILQRINYKIAVQRRLNPTQASSPSLLDTLTTSAIKTLILNQIGKLDSDLDRLDVLSVSCYLTCLTTLMEVAIALKLKCLPEKTDYKSIHDSLKRFTGKNWWQRFKAHRAIRETDIGINFLAKYALHLLTIIDSDTSKGYRALRAVFFIVQGLATVAASASIDQPWAVLKGVIDGVGDFKKAFDGVHDKKEKVFIHLNLLQAAYLGAGPKCLEDFKQFVKDLITTPEQAIIFLPMHNRRFFVLGFLELLQMIHYAYSKEDPEIGKKAVDLITLIKNNNSTTPSYLFRVRPKEATSNTRKFIVRQATQILVKIDKRQKVSGSPTIQNTNRLFPLVFNEKFFWLKSLQKQLQNLNSDRQLREDKPYIVDLKAVSRGHTGKLEDHLRSILRSKSLILIMGDPGSGKTLFLKQYIQSLLNNYKPGDPLPFYFSLGSVRGSKDNLIQLILREYGLQNYEEALKTIPTVWFLDAFDELFLGTSENPTNIYVDNEFKNWPNAQFVYTCRGNMLLAGDEQRYFAPPGKNPEQLLVSPFGPDEMDQFFTKYIEVKTKDKQPVWDLARYKLYIDKLGLKTIIRTPYYLRQIADYFPTLDDELHSLNIDSDMMGEKKEKDFLLDLLVSHNIKREADKTADKKGIPKRKPSKYFKFALRVCWLMHLCEVKKVPKRVLGSETEIERARARADYDLEVSEKREMIEEVRLTLQQDNAVKEQKEDQIDEINKKLVQCHNNQAKIAQDREKLRVMKTADDELQKLFYSKKKAHLRTEALIKLTPKGMEFAHELLFAYFLEVHGDSIRKNQLIESIDLPTV